MTNWVESATNEFYLRYFDWCVQQIHLAAREGFRRVKQIRGHYSGLFKDFLDEFGEIAGLELCLARLKRSHPRVLRLRGESLSSVDRSSLAKFDEFTRVGGIMMRIPKTIQERWPNNVEIDLQHKPTANEIRDVLITYLSKGLGQPVRHEGREFLEFRQSISNWIIFTNITVEEDTSKWIVRYSHTISARPDLNAELIGASISYLAWLGLPTTQWDYVLRDDLEPIAVSLLDFSTIFLSAAPRLLAGITNAVKVC